MLKLLPVITFLLLTHCGVGQTLESNEKDESRNWKFGFYLMPSVLANDDTSFEIFYRIIPGIQIERTVASRSSLLLALNYYYFRFESGQLWSGWCDAPGGDCNFIANNFYLEFPVEYKRYFEENKDNMDVYMSAGLVTTLSTSSATRRILTNGQSYVVSSDVDKSLRYQQSFFDLNFGLEFSLTERWAYYLEPNLRFSVQRIINWADFVNYAQMAGLKAGASFTF